MCVGQICNFFSSDLWPPRSNLTSKAILKISKVHSSETVKDIKTISFLQNPLVKYATFFPNDLWPPRSNLTTEAKWKISIIHNPEAIIDIKIISFLQSPLSNTQLSAWMIFDLRGQIWPLRPNGKFLTSIARKL